MQLVHDELATLKEVKDPLDIVAERFARRARILCLDEMQVTDITDAMLMSGLFEGLFKRGVVLVTTSNIEPDGLYYGGLQRERFLPAIALIKQHTEVVNIDSDTDYRLRALEQAEIYYTPLSADVNNNLEDNFNRIAAVQRHKDSYEIIVNHRTIPVVKWADGIAWFDFETLCNTPRAKEDYIEIAQFFHSVIIADVPVLDNTLDDAARRFVNMIDEFYDSNVKVIISAAVPPQQLYQGRRLEREFERTVSRLLEMQSKEYLARPHVHI